MTLYVAVDCGGTKLAFAAYRSLTDQIPICPGFTITTSGNYAEDLESLKTGIKRAAIEAGYSPKDITAIGITLPGRLNAARTMLEAAGNVTEWVDKEIFRDLQSAFGCHMILGNDGEGQALAEAILNPELAGKELLLVAPGTGIAIARIHDVDGRMVSMATEGAHQIINPLGSTPRMCGCGHNNCWESYASGDGIEKRYGKPASELTLEEWDEVAFWMEVGIANCLSLHMVPIVVLGGGVIAGQTHLVANLAKRLGSRRMNTPSPDVIQSGFGERAGTLGALAMLTLAA